MKPNMWATILQYGSCLLGFIIVLATLLFKGTIGLLVIGVVIMIPSQIYGGIVLIKTLRVWYREYIKPHT